MVVSVVFNFGLLVYRIEIVPEPPQLPSGSHSRNRPSEVKYAESGKSGAKGFLLVGRGSSERTTSSTPGRLCTGMKSVSLLVLIFVFLSSNIIPIVVTEWSAGCKAANCGSRAAVPTSVNGAFGAEDVEIVYPVPKFDQSTYSCVVGL